MKRNSTKNTAISDSKFLYRRSLFVSGQDLLLLLILVAIILIFGLSTRHFLRLGTFSVIVSQSAEIGLMALGMGLASIVNGVDLSVNDTANLSALIAGMFLSSISSSALSYTPLNIILTIFIALIMGTICGTINGFLIGYLRIPPILTTLGTMTLFRGISAAITGGKRLAGFPEYFSIIGRGNVFGIPLPFLILIMFGILIHVILNHTTMGFKIRMVGTNFKAARFSGIKDKSITMYAYTLSGILSSFAGIIIMSRTGSVAYEYGTQTYVLLALAITSLANVTPGFGSVSALVLATLILQTLSTGFYTLLLTSPKGAFFKDLFWGAFLVAVLAIGQIIRLKRTSSAIKKSSG